MFAYILPLITYKCIIQFLKLLYDYSRVQAEINMNLISCTIHNVKKIVNDLNANGQNADN